MTDPIEHLLRDHRAIMEEIAPLRLAIDDLRTGRPGALDAALPAFAAAERVLATQLLRHAHKEDEALFPAIEAALAFAGPTTVMRAEHRAIHERAAQFHEVLRELEHVEHPAIVAGGTRLRELTAGTPDARALMEIAVEVLDLVDRHFGKEEAVLFPIAHDVLSPETKAEVAAKLESMEAEAAK